MRRIVATISVVSGSSVYHEIDPEPSQRHFEGTIIFFDGEENETDLGYERS